MKDEDKTKEQLLNELVEMRQRVAELETAGTERKRAEEALRESKELFQKTVTSQRDAIVVLDAKTPPTILECNPATTEVFGYTRQEMLGRTTAFLHVDEAVLRKFQELLYPAIVESGFLHLPEFEMKRKDGTVFPTEHSVMPLEDEQGKRIGWVSVVRDITERKRAEEALQRRTAQLEVLRQVGLELTAQLNLDDLLQSIVSRAVELLGGTSGGLDLHHPDRDVLEWTAAVGPNMAPLGTVLHRGEGISGKVWETGELLIVDDYQHWEGRAPTWEGYAIAGIVGVPIRWSGEFLGTLLIHAAPPRTFSPADAELLSLFANQAAIAIHNARLFEREREQRDLAEALEKAAAALTATLDFDQVLDRILEQVSRVVPSDAANIMLIEGDQAHVVRWRGYERFGVQEFVSTLVFHIPEMPGFQQIVESGEPMVIPDTVTYPDWVRVPVTERLRSYAAAPIVVRGEVIGFLNVDSATSGFFTQAHADALRAFADHAAAAIENARLYEAERKRSAELETLRQASLHLTSALELQPILEAILDHTFKLVAADDVHVFLYDGKRLAFGAALWEDGRRQKPYAEPRPQGLTYTIARGGERIVIPDVNSHPLFRDYQWGGSIVGLPLRVSERVVGVMNVAFERPHVFDESELRVLGLLADQAAIAIENARLYEETRRRALEQETLREATLALTTALDRNRVIERILAQLQQVAPYDTASVQLLRENRMEIVGGRGFPNLPDLLGTSFPADGDNPNSEVIRTRAPFIVEDAPAVYEAFRKDPHRQAAGRSWLGVPMLVGEQLVGMIALDKREPGFYTQGHARLAEAFAAQAAVAIENARLFEEEKRRSTQLALINEVGGQAASILDPDRLMQEVTRSIRESFNYYNVALLLLDEEHREVVLRAIAGGFEHVTPGDYRQSIDEGIIGFVARTGNPWLANDTSKDPYYVKGFSEVILTKSELCIPIKLGDEIIGVLDVQSIRLNAFDQADVVAMEAVADRLAMGIQNARLYEEMAGLYDVGLAVTSALELDKTLRAIYEQVNHLMSFDTFYIALYDEARGELRFDIFVEEGEWLPKFTKELDEGGLTTWIVQSKKPLFVGDFEKESPPVVPGQVGKPETRSWLGFPLLVRDKIVGVISVQSFRPHAFTKEDERILSAFANQAAIAVENAWLYEETRQRTLQLQTVEEVGRRVSSILDLDELFPYVAQAIQQSFGYYHVDIFLVEPATGCAVFKASSDPVLEKVWKEQGLCFEIGEEGMIGWVAHTGEPLLANDVSQEPHYLPDELLPETKSELVVPLKVEERVVGVLDVDSDELNAFDEDDLFVLQTLSNQVAIAIENAHLFEETEHLKAFNESVVQGIAEAILIEDAQGICTFANPAAEELLGYTRKELIGQHWTTIVPEDKIEKVRRELAKRPRGTLSRYKTALLNKEGQVIPVIVSGRPLLEDGKFIGVLSAFTDIRERVQAEREIEERRLYLEGVLGAAPDAIVTLDARHRIVEWNPGAEKLFGYSREEVIGQNIDDLVTSPDVLEEAVGFTQVITGGGEVPPAETVRYRKDGSPVDVIVAGSPILVGGELIGTVTVYTDITARVRMEETLRALALVDDLTNLYNRRGFLTLGQQQLKAANRAKRRMMLLFADFDGLKQINDSFGHPEGDRALIETANVLRETFRESDIIARIGGDEFLVLAIETDGFPAKVLTARLQENLEARNAKGDLRYKLSLSIGIARYEPERPCSIDELVARADRAMYEKKQGDHQ